MTERPVEIRHVVRESTLFAGWREPIHARNELPPRMTAVREACEHVAVGPLTHIFRFDTPVDGFDSEIGFPVSEPVEADSIHTTTLRRLDFFAAMHVGPVSTLRDTSRALYEQMNRSGLSPELESVEIYHSYDPNNEAGNRIEVRAAFLAWPEIYREQLIRVLGEDAADDVWRGGEAITPFTLVDDRAAWVGESLRRLKQQTTPEQQFDTLSRVALHRPVEDTAMYRTLYEESGRRIQAVLDAQNDALKKTQTGGWIDPPFTDEKVLHLSKVARDRKAYDAAQTHDELRRTYCFCSLIREAENPDVDPIFCYRAAGWARQFWEPILGIEFKRCDITHSILKGDRFCAWNYHLPESETTI